MSLTYKQWLALGLAKDERRYTIITAQSRHPLKLEIDHHPSTNIYALFTTHPSMLHLGSFNSLDKANLAAVTLTMALAR